MFTLPRPKPHAPWYTQAPFKKWICDVFHLTSRKRSYQLLLTPKGPDGDIAWVQHDQRLFFINADLPAPPPGVRIRHDPFTDTQRRAVTLTAIAAHEAGHVRHSSRNRNRTALEHYVWNCLEDERMERLMTAEYPQLGPMFTYLGDIVAEKARPNLKGKVLEGVLFWRFDHDRLPHERSWHPAADRADLWEKVRPLVEQAWITPHAQEVDVIARQILALLSEHDRAPAPDQSDPTGAGGESGDPQDAGEGDGQQSGPAAGQRGRDPQDRGDKDASEQDANEQDASEQGSDEQGSRASSGDSREAAGGGGGAPDDHPSSTAAGQPTAEQPTKPSLNGEPELEASEHLFILVSASGAADPAQAEHPEPQGNVTVLAVGEDSDGSGTELPEGARVLDLRQAGAGTQAGSLPSAPAEDVASGEAIARNVEGYARMLAPLLHPPERPDGRVRHRSKGRFSYSRYARGDEKVFEHRERGGKPAPIFIDFAVDVSSSMSENELRPAREAALMLIKAAALCGSRARVVTFNTDVQEVIARPMPYLEAARSIAAIRSSGGTNLSRCLEHMFRAPPNFPHEQHVVVILCDGQLHDWDYERCAAIVKEQRRRKVRFIPVLISSAAGGDLSEWRAAFGTAVPCADTPAIARMIKTLLTTVRGSMD